MVGKRLAWSWALLALLLCSSTPYRTAMKAAKTAIKDASGQSSAQANLLAAVEKDSTLTDERRAKAYYTCAELQKSLNDAQNLKIYLKQQYDTATFYSTILGIYTYAVRADSLCDRYHQKAELMMQPYRANLLNGGKYMMSKGKNADAYNYFNMYARVGQDSVADKAAYWATLAAYSAGNHAAALSHIDRAIGWADSALSVRLLEYKAHCQGAIGDTLAWASTLAEGCRTYPAHDYFYLHLIDHYRRQGLYDQGLALADSVMARVGERDIYWLGKSQMYLAKAQYDACIDAATRAIERDSTLADAYYNKGVAAINKAIIFSRTMDSNMLSTKGKRDRVRLRGLYQYAREPLERLRALQPDRKDRWAELLYAVYLNLNLGQQFAEIEAILGE